MRSITAIRIAVLIAALAAFLPALAQKPAPASGAAELGSRTAKNGFRNETEIAEKFNAWCTDPDSRKWLAAMNYDPMTIVSVNAIKPHGEKSDVELLIRTSSREKREGISIKLVSGAHGFNQIDKRWLSHYVKMWKMPPQVEAALKLFVGETPPRAPGRSPVRSYLNELSGAEQQAVIDFFTQDREAIVSDLFEGDGPHRAEWVMVAMITGDKPKWVIRRSDDVIKYFGDGPVVITRAGNLKIGRITMQRKGGDGGRDTAKMLQFKVDPTLLFDAK